MTGHIFVHIMLCALKCQSIDAGVWDGDTIRINQPQVERIRILNIDAPELKGRCRYETELAQQSKIRLAEMLEGQKLDIRRRGKDKYGRTLAVLSVQGCDVGDELVREGLARTWSGRREPWC